MTAKVDIITEIFGDFDIEYKVAPAEAGSGYNYGAVIYTRDTGDDWFDKFSITSSCMRAVGEALIRAADTLDD